MVEPSIWDIERFAALTYTLFTIAALTTVLRFIARGVVLHSIGADDILALTATFTLASLMAFEHLKNLNNNRYLMAVRNGEPLKSGPIVTNYLTEADRMTFLNGIAYMLSLCLIKCAILAFYRRIVTSKRHRIFIYIIGGIIIAFTIGMIVASCLSIEPPAAIWYPYDPKYKSEVVCSCELLAVINSSCQTVFDLTLLALPVFIFCNIKLTRRVKFGILFLYLLATFSLSATLVRLVWSVKYLSMMDFLEKREALVEFSAWTVVEATTALICANLPPSTALLRKAGRALVTSVKESFSSSSHRHNNSEKHTDPNRRHDRKKSGSSAKPILRGGGLILSDFENSLPSPGEVKSPSNYRSFKTPWRMQALRPAGPRPTENESFQVSLPIQGAGAV